MNEKKVALVLSGAGNRCALQVGALRALFEGDFRPDMIVGTSAGALNGAFLATDPDLERVNQLASVWTKCTKDNFYPGDHLSMTWRALRGESSLFPNDNFVKFIQDTSPPEV